MAFGGTPFLHIGVKQSVEAACGIALKGKQRRSHFTGCSSSSECIARAGRALL